MPLPPLIGRQKEVVALDGAGHHAVLGTAGSGKTTMAVLRSMHLSHPTHPNTGRVLLVTFNNALVQYVRYLRAGGAASNIAVETYHKFARGYLHSRGAMRMNAICENDHRDSLIEEALDELCDETTSASQVLARPTIFFIEELRWMAAHGITDLAEYQAVTRTGRQGSRVDRGADRRIVWSVRDRYLERRTAAGRMYDWDDVAGEVTRQLRLDVGARRYQHVVIDEGQDFSPEMIRSLVEAVPDSGSVTFFGDVTQQIYGTRTSWRSAGLDIAETWLFKENYRNTREVARLALAIAQMSYFRHTPDIVEPNEPVAGGPQPVLLHFEDEAAEMPFVARQAAQQAAGESVAILLRTRADEDRLRPHLPRNAVRLHRNLQRWTNQPGIYYGTLHSAKGLEFDTVFIPRCSSVALPDPDWVERHGRSAAEAQDGRLLYVGVTRARTNLALTYSGAPTELLPNAVGLYNLQRR